MSARRPHVLYITPIFGYPPLGGPRLRTYNTLKALARCADVSLYLTQPPDTPDPALARAHLLTFCRTVVFPPVPPPSLLRRILYRLLPAPARTTLRGWAGVLREVPRPLRRSTHTPPAPRSLSQGAGGANHPLPRSSGEGDGGWGLTPPAAAATPPYEPEGLREIEGWIVQHRPDVVWLGFGGISYQLVPLRRRTGLPLVLETECVWSRFILRELPFASDPAQQAEIERAGHAKQAEECLGALEVDLTTAVSEVDAAYFRELAPDPERVMLLANVIDVAAYAADIARPVRLHTPALLFAGTLSHGTANLDAIHWLLGEVMPRVWQQRPDAHVYLVGRSPAPEVLAHRGPRVHVTGEVPSIVPYLRASAAALVPLRWESGTRFKILEAFAVRTPVISTTLGAEGLDVEDGKHLLLADDAAAFADAILSLLNDPSVGQRLVEPAYELVRSAYDLSAAERQIRAILDRLAVVRAPA